MVRIRLRRVGARNQPSYRIVAADQRNPRDGRFLEILGHYNPRTEPATIQIDEARFYHWMKNGAQPSESVEKILKTTGTWDRWMRFKEGEPLEALLQESQAEQVSVDPRTRREDVESKRPSKKAQLKAEAGEGEATEEPSAVAAQPEAPDDAEEEGQVEGEPEAVAAEDEPAEGGEADLEGEAAEAEQTD